MNIKKLNLKTIFMIGLVIAIGAFVATQYTRQMYRSEDKALPSADLNTESRPGRSGQLSGKNGGQGMGFGGGMMQGGQKGAYRYTNLTNQGTLSEAELMALRTVLADEMKAMNFYQAVIEKFGSVRPFSMIVQSEQQHIDELLNVYEVYGIAAPADITPTQVQVPATLDEACKVAVQAEIDNVALYDAQVTKIEKSGITEVFDNLAYASENMHKPAFERCGGR